MVRDIAERELARHSVAWTDVHCIAEVRDMDARLSSANRLEWLVVACGDPPRARDLITCAGSWATTTIDTQFGPGGALDVLVVTVADTVTHVVP